MFSAVPSPLSSNANDSFAYSITHIPHDEDGIKKYINEYRAFRLLSLQLSPEAFASTYAREAAFDNAFWYGRLSNLGANTFIAVRESGQVVGTATILGPLPYGSDLIPPAGNPWAAIGDHTALDEMGFSHYRINAIFTLPEARRRGISKALIAKSMAYIQNEARSPLSNKIICSVVVDAENDKAKALYESAGFIEVKKLAATENDFKRAVTILENKNYA